MNVYCAHADTGAMVEETANRLSTGRLRVHDHVEEWFAGYRRYRRGEKGDITEANDHLMRATDLMLVHALGLAITENRAASEAEDFDPLENERTSGRLDPTVLVRPCAEHRPHLVAAFHGISHAVPETG